MLSVLIYCILHVCTGGERSNDICTGHRPLTNDDNTDRPDSFTLLTAYLNSAYLNLPGYSYYMCQLVRDPSVGPTECDELANMAGVYLCVPVCTGVYLCAQSKL